ncbi:MAG: hydroxyacylglutathione hydrolase [Spongiibacteraceae bacterium]
MLKIEAIPAFRDNYIWLFYDETERAAWVVDPGEAQPVLAALAAKNLPLAGILVTHHHPDHVGGVAQLREHFSVPVYGPANTPAKGIEHLVREGDRVTAAGCEFSVIAVPGHTLDHIAYFCAAPTSAQTLSAQAPILFCGDTLFAGGCGRVFEGTFPMMYDSLQKLALLPASTWVYCAHEYTLSNLRFAAAVEPDNKALQQRTATDQQKRDRQQATVPSTLAVELATNPFLRCEEHTVRRRAESFAGQSTNSDAETFAILRGWKDEF